MLSDLVPLYPLYALLFVDAGLSDAQISTLFAIWSGTGILAEVPTGALADRFSRRGALVASGLAQASGYCVWILAPGFWGFAAGFVLWGVGGSLASGAREALLFDGLRAEGAEAHYAQVNGWVGAAGLLAELPTAVAAAALFTLGGYDAVGWVSAGVCVAAAGVALTLPEPKLPELEPPEPALRGDQARLDDVGGYLATVRAGIRAVAGARAVRAVCCAAALLGCIDALEEYFPLIAQVQGVAVAAVPLVLVPIALAGAVGAGLGGRANRLRPAALGGLLAVGMAALAVSGASHQPIGLVAIGAFYGLYRAVLVVVDARVQVRIPSSTRATVTSVVALGTDVASFGLYAAWSIGGLGLVALLGALIALVLPRLLRELEAGAMFWLRRNTLLGS